MSRCTITTMALVVLVLALAPLPLRAQSAWLPAADGRTIWLEALRPDMEDAGFATSVWQVGARFPVRRGMALVAEFPFAHGDFDLDASDETGATGLGNPYLGLEFGPEGGCTRGEIGARAPLASDDNLGVFTGFLGDFVDRAEAFAPDILPVTLGVVHGCPAGPSGWSARFRGAGSVWVPVDDGEVEVMALYGVQAWYEQGLVFGAGVTGRAILTEEGGLGERTVHQAGGVLGYDFGAARPVLELRVPLDGDLRDEMPYTLGLGVVIRR
ncbi:MAG TPA: hypothetical protein VM778_09210 [Gemmatimonadota bacterium]|nr:hypothetical protein [Gemmatimonadota bacterium]